MEKRTCTALDIFEAMEPEFFSEPECIKKILKLFYRGVPVCPRCAALLPENNAFKFWKNEQSYCPACGSKFAPASGTILKSCKLEFRQVVLVSILLAMGKKSGEIARRSKIDVHTVAKWRKKLKGE